MARTAASDGLSARRGSRRLANSVTHSFRSAGRPGEAGADKQAASKFNSQNLVWPGGGGGGWRLRRRHVGGGGGRLRGRLALRAKRDPPDLCNGTSRGSCTRPPTGHVISSSCRGRVADMCRLCRLAAPQIALQDETPPACPRVSVRSQNLAASEIDISEPLFGIDVHCSAQVDDAVRRSPLSL